MDDVDAAMVAASKAGSAARAWLELSLLEDNERALMQALASSFRRTDEQFESLLQDSAIAIGRWEALIAAEVGDKIRAHAIRLVGDALVANALVGLDSADEDVDELLRFLLVERGDSAGDR